MTALPSGGTTGGDSDSSVLGLRLRLDLLSAGEGSTALHGIVPFRDGSLVGYGYERLSDGNDDAFLMKLAATGAIVWAMHFGVDPGLESGPEGAAVTSQAL